jgi:hypothetical protein
MVTIRPKLDHQDLLSARRRLHGSHPDDRRQGYEQAAGR